MENKSEQPVTIEERYSEFVALAVHDLDSPLRKLGVFVERLSASLPGDIENAGLYIKRINSCLEEMRSLVSSLSELDSINGSKGYISCNMDAILREVLTDLEPEIKEKNATIQITSLPNVEGIPDQYQLLFKKLLQNALKFTSESKMITISISAEKIGKEETRLLGLENSSAWHRLMLIDNGIGFSRDDADRIFEPFNRLHGKSAYSGAGLGLTICKKIVENHQGRIFAEGDEHAGSRFIIIIPEKPNVVC